MNEKRFTDIWCCETGHIGVTDYGIDKEFTSIEFEDFLNELNEENVKQCERWKKLYELKDAEVTARVDGLNKVCNYYLNEVLFKSDVDPNKAVQEVINEILNTEVENDE